ncbi:BamA/TamA family outer membrane protein [Microcoleus sp. FACHB-SPT15]|uniref:BamA/TamA family outer membrane protein n=1 Tax=Microcoleus sp. FACHB-SPT15 TaxID=2692830 RepID=UPI00178416DA|nr:BamA/TamA family outer membrane protein [Microcoleus sp. FACHB-SPT15]MBD1810079.1 BamA/TamA family outer membrane protein [Microcoleus sp. FACHB-SPT15]
MRLSPLLAAMIAATASISLAKPTSGQTSQSVSDAPESNPTQVTPPTPNSITVNTIPLPPSPSREAQLHLIVPAKRSQAASVLDLLAQIQTQPEPVVPTTGDQSTPQQETPNTIEFDIPSGTPTNQENATPDQPSQPSTPETPSTQTAPAAAEARVLVAEVVVTGAEGALENEVFRVITTRPGQATTRTQLQADVNAVFATGLFSSVDVIPEDTPLGVRVTFAVQANPVLREVVVNTEPAGVGTRVLPQEVVNEIFSEQYGQILNLRDLQNGIQQLNEWYKENGYDLAQVIDAQQVTEDGRVVLVVAEGVIEDIRVRFLNDEGEATDEEGQPVNGRTRDFIITREVQLNPGDVFNRQTAERDLRRVFGLGIFEDVRLSFAPGTDPRQVVVVVDVIERNTGSVAAGAGISSASGLFGTISYQEQNLGGNNQTLGAEFQAGVRELLFDVRFTDPWIAGDPYRTSYTVNAFRRRSISLIFDGGEEEVELPNGDRPRVTRTGGGVTFTRPLSRDVFSPSEWTASLGLQYQRVSIRDSDGELSPEDELGNLLSFSEDGSDDLFTVQLGAVRDQRNNALRPTSGSLLRLGVEQSIPIGGGSILLTRLRGSYSYYIPVQFTNFTEGPQALAFNLQAGTVLGDLPPYEAFSLGGSSSVRGYDEGDVGAGRSFIQATAEYRFPIISVVGGALFVDFASDLGTGDNVPGNPAGVRDKPGTGFGFGVGVRVQSPLGPIRVDYGLNDEGDSRIHFGIGERF